MNVLKRTLKVFLMMFVLIAAHTGFSQTLEEKFNTMIEKSSTYEQYKVIKITEINDFWKDVDETLKARASNIDRLENNVKSLQAKIDTLENKLARTRANLEASQSINSSISFLGADMAKTSYHLLVWVVIVLLAALVVVVYFMFMKSNAVTAKMKKDFNHLNKEFEAHRDKSREAQVKLKRELQTAVNTIEDMKRGGTSRR